MTQADSHSNNHPWPVPECKTCGFVLPSQTSQTGLRCGLNYFKSSYIMRKFQLMQHFPVVHEFNACESWLSESDFKVSILDSDSNSFTKGGLTA
jgi:hypothetical protein